MTGFQPLKIGVWCSNITQLQITQGVALRCWINGLRPYRRRKNSGTITIVPYEPTYCRGGWETCLSRRSQRVYLGEANVFISAKPTCLSRRSQSARFFVRLWCFIVGSPALGRPLFCLTAR